MGTAPKIDRMNEALEQGAALQSEREALISRRTADSKHAMRLAVTPLRFITATAEQGARQSRAGPGVREDVFLEDRARLTGMVTASPPSTDIHRRCAPATPCNPKQAA